MKKKLAMLMFIILFSLAFHSCLDYSLPKKIELEAEGSIGLSVKIAEINEKIEIPSFDDIVSLSQEVVVTDGSICVNFSDISLEVSENFLHAKIGEGYITISLVDDTDNSVEATYTYDIKIEQKSNTSYKGFSDPATKITSARQPLENCNINRELINIEGTISISNSSKVISSGKIKITMTIKKFAELDWDFNKFSEDITSPALSLASIPGGLSWIEFNKCDVTNENREPTKGIGINMNLTELNPVLESKLEMSVGCKDLHINKDVLKPLHRGNNVFGNDTNFRLQLNDANQLEFDIKIRASGGNGVLHLENLEANKSLNIKGEINIFQYLARTGLEL